MEQIILPNVKEKVIDDRTSIFTVSPLFPGYGHTVGNALRRVLLSSLPGAAVTAVRIEGASHEFSVVKGVKEDLVEVILNLKSLRLVMHETNQPLTLKMDVKGPKEVTAADFKANSQVTIANPDLHIASIDKAGSLSMEVVVDYGRGYDPVERRQSTDQPLGTIAVDSLFSPVIAVSVEVENTRVGKMTNYDKLDLSVTTDGSISTKKAFQEAAAILVDQFQLLANYSEGKNMSQVSEANDNEKPAETNDQEKQNVSELEIAGLSSKISGILIDNGIHNIEELKNVPDEELKEIPGLGPKALSEINKIRG